MPDNGINENVSIEAKTPTAMAPNIAMSLEGNGYIKVTFSIGIMATTFFCDGPAARILSENFSEAAEAYDAAWAELAKMAEKTGGDVVEESDDKNVLALFSEDEVVAHDEAVKMAEESGTETDLN